MGRLPAPVVEAVAVTERQLIALTNPCATPDETLANEFYRALRIGSLVVTTILTVNK